MFGNSLSILYSALLSDRKNLEIRNRNVANVNNPDYVKEEPVLQNLPSPGGVEITDIRRLSDEVLQRQVLTSLTYLKGYEERKKLHGVIETYFDDTSGSGLGKHIDNFFRSVLQFLRDPSNEGAKESILSNGQNLIDAIKERYQQLTNLQNQLKEKISKAMDKMNSLAKSLAKVNKDIAFLYAKNKTNSNDYKTLLDERDRLLREIAEYVNVSYSFDRIGRVELNISEPKSTASGYIPLVSFSGEVNMLTFHSDTQKVEDSNGIEWPLNFFKNGKIGAYSGLISDIKTYKDALDNLATTLRDNAKITLNGSSTKIFNGTSASDLTLNITKSDLDNYDSSNSESDQNTVQGAWDTVREKYNDLSAKISENYTNYQIKYETERDLNQNLETKYNEKTGVNLDEELAEIMKLQQHYQAVSKMIATSTKLLDYLLSAIR